jgi:hypothetical protein
MAMIKKRNAFVRYFVPLRLKAIADILIIAGSILLIIGLNTNQTVLVIGLGLYTVASALAVMDCFRVLLSGVNKRAPVYKRALVNLIIMAVILGLSIFALIWGINHYYS